MRLSIEVTDRYVGAAAPLVPGKPPQPWPKRPASGPLMLTPAGFAPDEEADFAIHSGPDWAVCHYAPEHHPAGHDELGPEGAHLGLPPASGRAGACRRRGDQRTRLATAGGQVCRLGRRGGPPHSARPAGPPLERQDLLQYRSLEIICHDSDLIEVLRADSTSCQGDRRVHVSRLSGPSPRDMSTAQPRRRPTEMVVQTTNGGF